jgi:gamma-glutamyltranspeptidase/glutathione hydrolase
MTRLNGVALSCILQLAFGSLAFAGSQVTAKTAAISTTSPYATQIGLSVLKQGGTAVDAAVAVAFALAVVHPQAGNLGGGGFLIYYDAQSRGVWTLDFTAVAPLAATRDVYEKNANAARIGATAAAVPGTVAGLETMYRKFGKLPWKDLLQPAIRLARDGVKVDVELMTDLLEAQRERSIATIAPLFYPDGKAIAAGQSLAQGDLAATLTRISLVGMKDVYDEDGETAKKIVDAGRLSGGKIGFRDLRDYKPLWRSPVRITWRGFDVYTMAPPSAGGLVIGEMLNMLTTYDLRALGFGSPRAIHLIAEASRRAWIDSNKYLGDPETVRIPYRDLLSEDRAKAWRATIDPKRAIATAKLVEPGTTQAESNHTTHFTVADANGNIAAVTLTLGENFGGGYVVPGCGFFLNNEINSFEMKLGKPNALEPGKRPVTAMSPAIVLKGGKPYLALGTPGGSTIPTTILDVFLGVAVYGKSLYDAIEAPRFHQQAMPDELLYERALPQETIEALNAMQHGVREVPPIGDVHAIAFDRGKMTAVADPRHNGAAGGY